MTGQNIRRLALAGAAVAGVILVWGFAAKPEDPGVTAQRQANLAAAEQRRVTEEQRRLSVNQGVPLDPLCNWEIMSITLDNEWIPVHGDRCQFDVRYVKGGEQLYVKTQFNDAPQGPYHWGEPVPHDVIAIMNRGTPIKATLQHSPPRVK